jgi:hypothetical protein
MSVRSWPKRRRKTVTAVLVRARRPGTPSAVSDREPKNHLNLFFCAVAAKAGGYRTRVQILDRAEVPSEIDRRREEERLSWPGAETAAV